MYSIKESGNEYVSKNIPLTSNDTKGNELYNTSIIKTPEVKKKSILKLPTTSSIIPNTTNNEKKNLPLPMLDNHKQTKLQAFEILSKFKHIKGLEKVEEKCFLDIILNNSNDIKSEFKKPINLKKTIHSKTSREKKGKLNTNDKENVNRNGNAIVNNKNNDKSGSNINSINDIDNKEENNLMLSPKLMDVLLNIFSTLFWKLNVKSFQSLKEERKNEKVYIYYFIFLYI